MCEIRENSSSQTESRSANDERVDGLGSFYSGQMKEEVTKIITQTGGQGERDRQKTRTGKNVENEQRRQKRGEFLLRTKKKRRKRPN